MLPMRRNLTVVNNWRPLMAALFAALLAGCATISPPPPPIAGDDKVLLDYTCRLEDGAILATTSRADAFADGTQLSHAFMPTKAYAAIPITAGAERRLPAPPDILPLMPEIAYQVSHQLTGQTYEETHAMTVGAEAIEGLSDMARFIQFARTMQRPKQRSVPKEQFVANTGQEPSAGQVLFPDQVMQWQVIAVKEDTVEVRYLIEDGKKVMMHYGEAVVRDRGDHYDFEIDVRLGGLVRVGPYIGRISKIDDRLFTVDFDHPFGGRELACEVTAHPLEQDTE
ncbi:hypothetical protein DSCA_22940 [Desulfosarcina alkanivorans]|uniref:Uncharacterized protein n=1 Tax=Desulfosarcina alkanivorans TaxID=571177 RepID=A0A5K7YPY1_9BACT|nr:hypothetical protein [Desulfosarcina alkanivorans]BBO68364.1 hypothetical protein DSCA_22940 [Desulfosarcina alkanivorans]